MSKKEKTLKQSKREILITLLIMGIIAVTLTIVGFAVENLVILGFIGLLMIAGTIYGGRDTMQRLKRSYCPACGKRYDYEEDIAWEVSEVVENDKQVTAMVEFECKCQSCEKTTDFRKKFVISRYDAQKNRWVDSNIKQLAKRYFLK